MSDTNQSALTFNGAVAPADLLAAELVSQTRAFAALVASHATTGRAGGHNITFSAASGGQSGNYIKAAIVAAGASHALSSTITGTGKVYDPYIYTLTTGNASAAQNSTDAIVAFVAADPHAADIIAASGTGATADPTFAMSAASLTGGDNGQAARLATLPTFVGQQGVQTGDGSQWYAYALSVGAWRGIGTHIKDFGGFTAPDSPPNTIFTEFGANELPPNALIEVRIIAGNGSAVLSPQIGAGTALPTATGGTLLPGALFYMRRGATDASFILSQNDSDGEAVVGPVTFAGGDGSWTDGFNINLSADAVAAIEYQISIHHKGQMP